MILDSIEIAIFCLDEGMWHSFHEIVDEDPESPMSRETTRRVVRLKYEPHLFEAHHIISHGRTRYLEIVFLEEGLRAHDFSSLQIFFDDVFEDLDFSLVYFFHIIFQKGIVPEGHHLGSR